MILNETAVATYFPAQDPIGRTFNGATIVGVVGDARQNGVERDVIPEMYSPLAQGRAAGAELLVRTAGDPYDSLGAVRAAGFAVLPDVPLRNVTTTEEMFLRRMAQRRLNMLLLGLFGLVGLTIAGTGVYGLMSFLVDEKTREIGVRMALGASRGRVVGTVVVHALALVAVGVALGSSMPVTERDRPRVSVRHRPDRPTGVRGRGHLAGWCGSRGHSRAGVARRQCRSSVRPPSRVGTSANPEPADANRRPGFGS